MAVRGQAAKSAHRSVVAVARKPGRRAQKHCKHNGNGGEVVIGSNDGGDDDRSVGRH